MTATVKRWILGGLIVVLAFVWWDSLSPMFHNSSGTSSNERLREDRDLEGVDSPIQRAITVIPAVSYRSPKVNPFAWPRSTRVTDINRVEREEVSPQPISETVSLLGIVDRAGSSHAVVAIADSTAILQVGDSLLGWHLHGVGDDFSVWRWRQARDTVYLRGASRD